MRVLVIAARDVGGCMYYLCQEQRARGVNARLITLAPPTAGGFPTDIADVYDGGAEIRTLIDTADVLHFVDVLPSQLELFDRKLAESVVGRPVIVQLDDPGDGLLAREARRCATAGRFALITTRPGIARRTGATLLAPFVPWWRGPWTPLLPGTRGRESVRRPGVVFASSLEPLHRKAGLERLIDEAEGLLSGDDLLETACERSHRAVQGRRRFAHVALVASRDGLGLSGFEAMAQGLEVVCDLDPDTMSMYATLAGGSAPPVRPSDELAKVVAGLEPRRGPHEPSITWARAALDPTRWYALHAEAKKGEPAQAA